ncbi:hypothetical protein PIB30_068556 [Stylosanthes scabra]|uniref:Uncharacterized protein n=1 Tax=Stylosanthes scabra TaxID=79078 RepID=A0ABU6SN19_9FABA|nr:hypothetical protein [Stylosanthes scabra]
MEVAAMLWQCQGLKLILMARKGKALTKTSNSTAAGSTVGDLSQPLNESYFDTEYRKNTGKLVVRILICERLDFISIIHVTLHRGLCFSLSVGMRPCAPFWLTLISDTFYPIFSYFILSDCLFIITCMSLD